MPHQIDSLLWSTMDLPALLEAVARHAGIPIADPPLAHPPATGAGLRVWFENTCVRLGIEIEAVGLWGARAEAQLRAAAPAVLPTGDGWLALIEVRGATALLLSPARSLVRVPFDEVRTAAVRGIEEPYREEVNALLASCGITGAGRDRAVRALIRERARYDRGATLYQLRLPPSASFLLQCRQAGVIRRLAIFALAHTVECALWIAAWGVLGTGALEGHVDPGWLAAWVLILATLVPLRMLSTWSQGVVAIAAGGLLRQRLLAGALRLLPEEVRHEGAGHFLTRSIEAEQVESLALSGGLASGLALIEIALAMAVLGLGAGGWLQALALAVWSALAAWCILRYWRARTRWTDARLPLTQDLVESMTGHRTRLAQQPSAEWHTSEDRQSEEYALRSAAMDRTAALLDSLVPRGWMVAGIASLAPAFLSTEASPAGLAVSVGGVLLAWRALKRLVTGAGQLCGAAISWREIETLFHAAARKQAAGLVAGDAEPIEAVLEARDLRLQRNGRTVLDGIDLELRPGDRVLLEGESGGGKSTLISLLAGLREPSGGLLLSGGLDRRTLGDKLWRRRVVAVPQYHENHVLTGPFAYNLLIGGNWPANPEDFEQAYQVCQELGLGPLLERMPGGLMQMVGETGWQLSQGERSRLYMARALLQQPDAVILDESFAALDPENLRLAMNCAMKRAKTLLVVAHP